MKSDNDTLYDFVISRYPGLRRSAFLMCGDWSVAEEHTQAVLARFVSETLRGTVDDPDAQVYGDLMAGYQHRPPRREHIFVAPPGGPEAKQSAGTATEADESALSEGDVDAAGDGSTGDESALSEGDVDAAGDGSTADEGEPESAVDPVRTVLVLDALHRLSPRCRAVLVLRHWDGFAVDETADMLGLADARVEAYEAAGLAALDHLLTPATAR